MDEPLKRLLRTATALPLVPFRSCEFVIYIIQSATPTGLIFQTGYMAFTGIVHHHCIQLLFYSVCASLLYNYCLDRLKWKTAFSKNSPPVLAYYLARQFTRKRFDLLDITLWLLSLCDPLSGPTLLPPISSPESEVLISHRTLSSVDAVGWCNLHRKCRLNLMAFT